ncbi:NAD(P)H-dependent glycerol-3-phosphate dehydrogenase [Streptobacillus ratti]|uniref:NAD(P)H-dependent glycerol-3-phosphate dehydrogenase n=1 Tax=Streptobacillus ratti TaxID=1720557 RepID=UPI000932AA52|nr:NAD(P)H-dependent glycerol-3-phosphate dehydrogenase [Streptobacillus ratti]
MNILTIGGGSWGTALTYLLDKKGHKCFLWEYNEDYRKQMKEKRENENFLKGFKLSESIEIVDDYGLVLENENIDIILLATPTQFLRNTLNKLKESMKKKYILVNVAKGIEVSTGLTISNICEEVLKDKEYEYVLLAGPTHAEEVVNNMPSVILSVSKNIESAKIVQQTFNNSSLRVYTGVDVIGAELGGAIKNCLAICAGICDGLGYGDNTKAALLTRGMNEIILIGSTLGADPLTFMGLTGLGDMIVTCTSKHSRNRYLGEQIGKGRKLEDIVSEMKMVSEGATTIKALYQIIKKNEIRTPIFTALYELLYENKDISTLTQTFMERELRSEF